MGRKARRASLWRRWVVKPWRRHVLSAVIDAERESREATAKRGDGLDWRTMGVCLIVAINLTLLQYFGLSNNISWVPGALRSLGLETLAVDFEVGVLLSANVRFYALMYWAACCLVLYFIVPAVVIKLAFKQRLADYGLGWTGALRHIKLYVVLYLLVLPLIILVSFDEQFLRQYPFYKDETGAAVPPFFGVWEVAYAVQFFALEFFFRGFMVHGLKHRFGAYAVFVMMVPYCMIHFGKPFPETLGAIVAGLVLGFLALRTGTIWLGFLIHVSVALTMDLVALAQQGLL